MVKFSSFMGGLGMPLSARLVGGTATPESTECVCLSLVRSGLARGLSIFGDRTVSDLLSADVNFTPVLERFDVDVFLANFGGLPPGLLGGVPALLVLAVLYKSAVAGRGRSGRLGRRIGADINPWPFVELEDVSVGLVGGTGSITAAGGGRA